ncbi:hypothetical protein MMC25_002050 [Agyrium rufum]|nr:hypothetical protein [Agyrium rufum]
MATAEPISRPQDRHSRRRPFASWMKRLANLKNSSSDHSSNEMTRNYQQPNTSPPKSKTKKSVSHRNNPYPESWRPGPNAPQPTDRNAQESLYSPSSLNNLSYESTSQSRRSFGVSCDGQRLPNNTAKSAAPTVATEAGTIQSEAANSKAGTSGTAGGPSFVGVGGGEGSTFSSPAPSIRSMATTLTTLQSTAPSNMMHGHQANHQQNSQTTALQNQQNSQFVHQFPVSSPASAIPPHLAPQSGGGHPATFQTATANSLLTDNASILTLASSSKRRRRNSLDTNASVRAMAPSSLWGGSRESLPLSVLSSNLVDPPLAVGMHQSRNTVGGLASAERASVYSSSGVVPALNSERNSYVAPKQPGTAPDATSIRSCLMAHGRNDSITGSIGGIASATSPLQSPREFSTPGRISRRNSGWGEIGDEENEEEGGSEELHREKEKTDENRPPRAEEN